MPRLFLGNFRFEQELAGAASSSSVVVETELLASWLAMAEPGDAILCPEVPRQDELRLLQLLGALEIDWLRTQDLSRGRVQSLELVPWGWSSSARRFAADCGLIVDAPVAQVVQRVNSRQYRCQLEHELGIAPAGVQIATTGDELLAAIQQATPYGHQAGWVLKAQWGMAARERMLGRGLELSASAAGWARKRLARDGCLVVEPWFERIAEAGLQLAIPRQGPVELIGVTPLLTDAGGQYRGSQLALPESCLAQWRPAAEVALQVAGRLQAEGYFGPLGIDALIYRDADQQVRLRPLMDLNARYTMGRLSLGWHRLLPPDTCASWLHGSRSGTPSDLFTGTLTHGSWQPTSLETLAGRPMRRWSGLLMASTLESLRACEAVRRRSFQ